MHIESGGVSGGGQDLNMSVVHRLVYCDAILDPDASLQNGGVIVWQLNDCWPVISWAIADYFVSME